MTAFVDSHPRYSGSLCEAYRRRRQDDGLVRMSGAPRFDTAEFYKGGGMWLYCRLDKDGRTT